MNVSATAGRRLVETTVVTEAADQVAYHQLLLEQRTWIEREMAVRLQEVQPSAVEEYADPFRHYAACGTAALLARADGRPVGIAAMKAIGSRLRRTMELKRVFVREDARGCGAGRALVSEALDLARTRGARCVVLETHEGFMSRAVSLYRDLGFVATSPLGVTRHPGVVTMELVFDGPRAAP